MVPQRPYDPKRPKDIRSAWDNAIRKAGIENFRFHDLRHTAASYLAIDGHSLLDIATLLGHKSLQMTKRYAHLSQDYKRRMVSSNNKRLFGEKKTLTVEEYEAYLKFDQLNMDQFLSLLEGPQFFDFLKVSIETKKYPLNEMAKSSIRAGNIQGNGLKDETTFAVPLYNWLEWAISKQLKLPQAL